MDVIHHVKRFRITTACRQNSLPQHVLSRTNQSDNHVGTIYNPKVPPLTSTSYSPWYSQFAAAPQNTAFPSNSEYVSSGATQARFIPTRRERLINQSLELSVLSERGSFLWLPARILALKNDKFVTQRENSKMKRMDTKQTITNTGLRGKRA